MKRPLVVAVIVAIVAAAWFIYQTRVGVKPLPEGLIQANGRIEGDTMLIASKLPGRIARLEVREGDSVKPGQVLVTLEDAQVRAKAEQAARAAEAARMQMLAARGQTEQAARDAERLNALLKEGTATRREWEQANLAHEVARRSLSAARAQYEAARHAQSEAESVVRDLTITAPAGGVVTARFREQGEVVGAGSPILSIVDLDRLYLQVYVPELLIGKLRLGLPARIYFDAFPDTPVDAVVRYISSRAEFTPKEVQTPDERVKLVFAVRLYLTENPDHRITPGLPADAVIRWRDDAGWPASL
ncbi:MAG TPA: efflux RND transporter periplasmic adaptor subunit [Steroidobacteraceae bacterium]